ncbi:MAG: hypothetical protein IPM29_20635 [Planctomycetes bacterium]|nr:hypothetical protein [Planctomycetota bacterium]
MDLGPRPDEEIDALPRPLRDLLEAELAAGNAVAEVGHGYPAPPVGCYVRLARPVTTRPRASGDGIVFCERTGSSHAGEFADAQRHFFVLEPPRPSPPEPDMDAIRAALEARQLAADAERQAEVEREIAAARERTSAREDRASGEVRSAPDQPDPVARFLASMVIDYERWREGTGYDLSSLAAATPTEREAIEALLVGHGVRDWRDVEALAALDTPRARSVLRETLAHGSAELAVAVLRHAGQLATDEQRTAVLVAALGSTTFYHGLTQTLLEVEEYHPPAVIDALLRGVLHRTCGEAIHFVAMLMFLHGRTREPFDWTERPYFLEFHTEDRQERERLFRDLCARIGVDPARFLTDPRG